MWGTDFYFTWYLLGAADQECGGASYGEISWPVFQWPWAWQSLKPGMLCMSWSHLLEYAGGALPIHWNVPSTTPGENAWRAFCIWFYWDVKPLVHEESPMERGSRFLALCCQCSDFLRAQICCLMLFFSIQQWAMWNGKLLSITDILLILEEGRESQQK